MIAISDITVAIATVNEEARAYGNRHMDVRRSLSTADADTLRSVAQTLIDNSGSTGRQNPITVRAIAGLTLAAGLIASARVQSDTQAGNQRTGVTAVLKQIRRRSSVLSRLGPFVASAVILGAALIGGLLLWDTYMNVPWTRDGQIRVQTVRVAPRVSGEITRLAVSDNEFVRRGDLLYVVDPFDYAVAFASADAEVNSREADLAEKENRNERRRELTTLSTSVEEKQQFDAAFKMATASLADARAKRSQAQVNLRRTEIRSPVNGYVTNLLLREGDYATTGVVNIAVIDTDSYWVDGYFEETKLERIRVGDAATVRLMGYRTPVHGAVDSLTRGISSAQAASNIQGLPSVDPVYTWVRLAQRIPVRVRIVSVPPDVPLVAGMTCSVTVIEGADRRPSLTDRVRHVLRL